ncbi:MAG: endonuclease NucS [Halobacteriales archaeon]|nr:endonuclease NucS [Halobacteriales archaeon]
MSTDAMRVFAGECTVDYRDATLERRERGHVVVLCKPDNTLLVHDPDGYRPVAWLTRPAELSVTTDPTGFTIEAVDDDRRLSVSTHVEHGRGQYPASAVGEPIGTCPECAGTLIRADRTVTCLGCGTRYGLPADAELLEATCEDCGLPRMRVERGAVFELCIDRGCEPLDVAVAERFDGAWTCPDCAGDLRIRRRGTLLAGCERYPACETGFVIPHGTVDGDCSTCGLPAFATPSGRQCLDATCPGDAELGDIRSA